MAVAVETFNANGSLSAASVSFDLTIGSGNLILVCVGYVQGAGAPTGVTWNTSESFTLLKRQRESISTGFATDIWRLFTPSSGLHSLEVTLSAATNVLMAGWGLSGVDVAGTPFGDSTLTGGTADTEGGQSDPATVTASGFVAGAMTIDMLSAATASTIGANQSLGVDNASFGLQFGSSFNTTNGVMSWTKDGGGTQHWCMAAVVVLPTAAAGGVTARAWGFVTDWNDPTGR